METVSTSTRVLSATERESFVGRTVELERLLAHGRGESVSTGIAVLAPPASGSSELLTQVYDHLFLDQDVVSPFYYCVKSSDSTSQAAASRFLKEFLTQSVAFKIKDPSMVNASPELKELSDLAGNADWLHQLIDSYHDDVYADIRSFVRHCLSAPLRAAAGGVRMFVIIDDLHNALTLEGGAGFLDDITSTFQRSPVPVVFCGQRRFLYGRTGFPIMRIEQLSFSEGGRLVAEKAASLGVPVNDQTRDLIVVQLGCSAGHISTFMSSAHDSGAGLSTFSLTEQFYTDELFGGRLSRRFDDILDRIAPDLEAQARLVGLLKETVDTERHRSPLALWSEQTGMSDVGLRAVLDSLYHHEMINLDASHVTLDTGNILLRDYIEARALLGSSDKRRALIVGETTAKIVRRAPELMSRFYRKNSSLGLLEIMESFDGRQISSLTLDYTRYKNELKGGPREQMSKAMQADRSSIRLPKCVFSAVTSAYYPPLDEICEPERSATAICVIEETGQAEIAWIAVEIDSKLEASRKAADFWCDRLEMAALNCNFDNYKLWLVAPEGFDDDAMATLNSRGAIGSSRQQVEILHELLSGEKASELNSKAEVYEFIVPMGDDTEMIAAHTVEEIVRRHNFPTKVINQIKTALVEACINAAEHSLSPDRRIYQTFAVEGEKITITVANRGLRLTDKDPVVPGVEGGRRGWGLKLIKSLMDEVRIETSDDGTRITMTKHIARVTENGLEPKPSQ